MIDLTPLDVRKKRGDFRRILRGYEPEEVDTFLQLAAERLEELVRENLALGERVSRLQEQVGSLESRERAVHDALVTAEQLRSDVKQQAGREAQMVLREAEAEARRIVDEAERAAGEHRSLLSGLERERRQFLGAFRSLLERQMERLETEETALQGEEHSPHGERRGAAAGRRTWAVGSAGPGTGVESPAGSQGPVGPDTPPAPSHDAPREPEDTPARQAPRPGTAPPENAEDLSSWLAGFLEEDDPQAR